MLLIKVDYPRINLVMLYFVILFTEIFILFLLSRSMSKTLSKFMSINFLSVMFLPGVIIHELSHMLAAVMMFVPVGDIEFMPKKVGDSVKLGSIQIAKTDPIRRSMIGFAPIFFGLMLVIAIVYLFTANILFFKDKDSYIFVAVILAIGYLLFAITNTMFSSSRDMEGTIEIVITLLIIFTAAYVIGFRPSLSFINKIVTYEVLESVKRASLFLLAPIAIDIFILGIIKLLRKTR